MTSISLTSHVLMVVFVTVMIFAVVHAGYRARRADRLQRFSNVVGAAMLGIWLVYNAYYFTPAIFSWKTSLPLHVCDILAPVAAWALIGSGRIARSLLYFAGIVLAAQALITPTGIQDPAGLRFWLYWILHGWILACCALDLVVRRFRPTWQDYRSTVLVELGYVAIILPVNVAFGWNYGYIGNSKPDGVTLIDSLGPWPERVPLILLLGVAAQGVMLVPWTAVRRKTGRPRPIPHDVS